MSVPEIRGDVEGIATDAKGLQEISDVQAQIMQQLGSTMEGLRTALQSPAAGEACQQVGERLQVNGMRFSARFAEHSEMMQNNGATFVATDDDAMGPFNAVMANMR